MSGGENQGGYFGPATSFTWQKFVKALSRLLLCVGAVTLLVIVITILLIWLKVPI